MSVSLWFSTLLYQGIQKLGGLGVPGTFHPPNRVILPAGKPFRRLLTSACPHSHPSAGLLQDRLPPKL